MQIVFFTELFFIAQGSHPRPLRLQWWEGPKSRLNSDGNSEQMWLFSLKNVFLVGYPAGLSWYSSPCGLHVVFCLGFFFFFQKNTVSLESTMTTSQSEWRSALTTWRKHSHTAKAILPSSWNGCKYRRFIQGRRAWTFWHDSIIWTCLRTKFSTLLHHPNHYPATMQPSSIQTALTHETTMVNAAAAYSILITFIHESQLICF